MTDTTDKGLIALILKFGRKRGQKHKRFTKRNIKMDPKHEKVLFLLVIGKIEVKPH